MRPASIQVLCPNYGTEPVERLGTDIGKKNKKTQQHFYLKSNLFQNCPKRCQLFGLLLNISGHKDFKKQSNLVLFYITKSKIRSKRMATDKPKETT